MARTPVLEDRYLQFVAAKNEAEQHFETYLDDESMSFEYELPAGDKLPDYWVSVGDSVVVCEVCHVTARLTGSGAFDAHRPITKAVKRKSAQGRALEGETPYVVVLWAPMWPADDVVISGALFGRPHITMPFDQTTGTADPDRADMGFGLDAALHETSRKHIGAVAIIRRFNPGLRAAQDEVVRRRTAAMSPEDSIDLICEVHGRRSDEGLLDVDARRPRLVVFHNPYASVPLARETFRGPFDEQYAEQDGRLVRVFEGDEVFNLPR